MPTILLVEAIPWFAKELARLLIEHDESDLASQVDQLEIFDRCRCGDDFCSTFYTQSKPEGAWAGEFRGCILAPESGMLILDIVDERIACVEVLNRDDLRRDLLLLLPDNTE